MRDLKQKQKIEYITLTKASNLCKYSQEYLSLRARSGKLKADKLGRNWYTTKEWLEEYLTMNGKEFSVEGAGNFATVGEKAGWFGWGKKREGREGEEGKEGKGRKEGEKRLSFSEFYKKHNFNFSGRFALELVILLAVANVAAFSMSAASGRVDLGKVVGNINSAKIAIENNVKKVGEKMEKKVETVKMGKREKMGEFKIQEISNFKFQISKIEAGVKGFKNKISAGANNISANVSEKSEKMAAGIFGVAREVSNAIKNTGNRISKAGNSLQKTAASSLKNAFHKAGSVASAADKRVEDVDKGFWGGIDLFSQNLRGKRIRVGEKMIAFKIQEISNFKFQISKIEAGVKGFKNKISAGANNISANVSEKSEKMAAGIFGVARGTLNSIKVAENKISNTEKNLQRMAGSSAGSVKLAFLESKNIASCLIKSAYAGLNGKLTNFDGAIDGAAKSTKLSAQKVSGYSHSGIAFISQGISQGINHGKQKTELEIKGMGDDISKLTFYFSGVGRGIGEERGKMAERVKGISSKFKVQSLNKVVEWRSRMASGAGEFKNEIFGKAGKGMRKMAEAWEKVKKGKMGIGEMAEDVKYAIKNFADTAGEKLSEFSKNGIAADLQNAASSFWKNIKGGVNKTIKFAANPWGEKAGVQEESNKEKLVEIEKDRKDILNIIKGLNEFTKEEAGKMAATGTGGQEIKKLRNEEIKKQEIPNPKTQVSENVSSKNESKQTETSVNKQIQEAVQSVITYNALDATKLPLTGGTISGTLTVEGLLSGKDAIFSGNLTGNSANLVSLNVSGNANFTDLSVSGAALFEDRITALGGLSAGGTLITSSGVQTSRIYNDSSLIISSIGVRGNLILSSTNGVTLAAKQTLVDGNFDMLKGASVRGGDLIAYRNLLVGDGTADKITQNTTTETLYVEGDSEIDGNLYADLDIYGASNAYIADSIQVGDGTPVNAILGSDSKSMYITGDLEVGGRIYSTATQTSYKNTYIVAKSGGDYTLIQSAIDACYGTDGTDGTCGTLAADNGALIKVMPGNYSESITMRGYIDIISDGGPEVTKITQSVLTVVTSASNSRLEGFTISKTTDDAAAVITVAATSPVLENLIIAGAGTTTQVGIDITAGNPEIKKLEIRNCLTGVSVATGSPVISDIKAITSITNGIVHTGASGTVTVYRSRIAGTNDITMSGAGGTVNSLYNHLSGTTNFSAAAGTTINSYKDVYATTAGAGTFNQRDYSSLTVRQDSAGIIAEFKDGADTVFAIADGGQVQIGSSTIAIPAGTAVNQGALYITAPTALDNSYTMFGIGRDGALDTAGDRQVFRVDANGNIYGRSLSLSGSTSYGSTTVTGDFEQSGGKFTVDSTGGYLELITDDATKAGLSISQTGAGNIIEAKDSDTIMFSVADGGLAAVSNGDYTATYANGAGDLYVENDLEVGGTLYVDTLKTPYANTLTVAKSGGDYTLIQSAINACYGTNGTDGTCGTLSATNGAVINVMPGNYSEAITMRAFIDVVATGGSDTAVITQSTATIITGASNCRLQGFTLNKTTDNTNPIISVGATSGTYESLNIAGAGIANQIAFNITSGSPKINNARIDNVSTAITTATGSPTIVNANIFPSVTGAVGVSHTGASGTTTIRNSRIAGAVDIYASGSGSTINSHSNLLLGTTNFNVALGATINSYKDSYTTVTQVGTFNQKDYAINSAIAALTVQQDSTGNIVDFKDGAASVFAILDGGNVGINTIGPDRKLDILDASNPQLRLTHTDGTIYSEFKTDANGDLSIITTGDEILLDAAETIKSSGAFSIKSTTGDLTLETLTSGNFVITSSGNITQTYAGGQMIGAASDAITLGNSGDTLALTSSDWGISATGAMTGISGITGDAGGISIIGGTGAGDDLTLVSTSHATKGDIYFHSASYYMNSTGDLAMGGRMTFESGEYASNEVDGFVLFQGSGGSDNTDLTFDLDGTSPIIYSATDSKVSIDDDLQLIDAQTISTSSGDLTLDAGTNLVFADTTVQFSSGSSTFDVYSNSAATTLAISNSDGTQVANLNLVDGSLYSNNTQRMDNSGNLVNIGNITGAGAVQLASTSGDLTLTNITSGNIAINSLGSLTTSYSGGQIIGTGTDAITLGNSGDTLALTSSDWGISATGALTGISGIENDGAYTQTGTSANAFTGTSTFSNATYSALFTGGNVGIGDSTPTAQLTVKQTDAAAIVDFKDNDTSVFTIADGGAITATQTADLSAGQKAFYFKGAGTSSTGGSLMYLENEDADVTPLVVVAQSGNTIMSLSNSGQLTVAQEGTGETNYGMYSTATGAGTTNVGGYFSATNATNNYGLIVAAGRSGFGTTTPSYFMDITSSSADYLTRIYNTSTDAAAGGLYIRSDGTGNLLTLNYNGTDKFTVSPTQITSSVPISITAPGDTEIAYDLLFSNPTSSNIKSSGPLYIVAGDAGSSVDLSLSASNDGYVVVDDNLIVNTFIGVGTTSPTAYLDVKGTTTTEELLTLHDYSQDVFTVDDGGETTMKPAYFDYVYNFDGGSTYTDNTTEAKSSAGTSFTIFALETSNDYFYTGLDHKFSTIYIDIATAGAGVTLGAEYYNGSAWTTLTKTDNTTNLTVDGTITFTAPTDWATVAVNSQTKYWVRLNSTGTSITTAPAAYSVSPTTGTRLALYAQNGDSAPALKVDDRGYIGIGTASPTYPLEISRSSNGYALALTRTAGSQFGFYISSVDSSIGTMNNTPFGLFVNNGSNALTVDTNSNVGIGDSSPTAKLTVKQTGTDAIVDFKDDTVSVFTITDGGKIAQNFSNQLKNADLEMWVGGTAVAPTGWTLSGTGASVARSTDEKYGDYAATVTYGSADAYLYQDLAEYEYYQSRTVNVGAWVKTAVASNAKLVIDDGVTTASSAYHTGGGAWEFLNVRITANAAATRVRVELYVDASSTATFDAITLTEGPLTPSFVQSNGGNAGLDYLVTGTSLDATGEFAQNFKNLVKNSDFNGWSAGVTSIPDSWTAELTPTYAQDAATPKFGSISAQITGAGAASEGITQAVSVRASTKYTASFYYKIASGDTMAFDLSGDSSGSLASEAALNSTSWIKKTYTVTTGASDTTLTLKFTATADTDIFYLDGASLTEGVLSPSFASRPLDDSNANQISVTDNSSAALTVIQSGTGAIVDFKDASTTVFTIDGSGNTTIGGAAKTVAITSANWSLSTVGALTGALDLSGATVTFKPQSISLIPEYPNSVYFADGGNNLGTLTSDYDSSAYHNYYEWTSSSDNQDYDIVVRWLVPEDFSSFDNTYGVKVYDKVSDTSGNTDVKFSMKDTGNAAVTFSDESTQLTWGTAASWTLNTAQFSVATPPTFTASDSTTPRWITFQIKLTADNADTADVGEISFRYNRQQ